MDMVVKARKWGDSVGIILPKRVIAGSGIKPDDILRVEVFKEADFSDLFGTLERRVSGQRFKDMAREGWEQ
ncbi:AbrB/MazE/SpoVT family DNA-binding domain-containing protein [Candidatus Woesearchaeota archaeon]|nr:AbrB/MazE/SpoVT family DNA-binding domain-containing protein [Candidatus Woesearchaeota archaeon]